MTDYLAEILALLEDGDEADGLDWPEERRPPANWKNSAPEGEPVTAAFGGEVAGQDRPRRVYIDDMLQEDHLEWIQEGQGELLRLLSLPAGDQEPPPGQVWGDGPEQAPLPRDTGEDPAWPGGTDGGPSPLLAQLRRGRLAVEFSHRRDSAGSAASPGRPGAGREPLSRPEEDAGRTRDTAQLVDRAFRRDARRYDGGFTLF